MRTFCKILILVCFTKQVLGQSLQATIRKGNQANSVVIMVRATANFVASPTNIQLTLGVPKTGARPALTVSSNHYADYFNLPADFIRQTAEYEGDYFVYLINLAVPTFQNQQYQQNAIDTLAELTLAGLNPADLGQVRLMQLPNGLASTGAGNENGHYNTYFELNGIDRTLTANRFFSNTGGIVVNEADNSLLSYVTIGTGVLPVRWLKFNAQPTGNRIVLSWQVVQNNDTKSFMAERSKDGIVFEPIFLLPATNTIGNQSYQFHDDSAYLLRQSKLYYRIKQMDNDGTTSYSEVKRVNLDLPASWKLYPNPASGGMYVQGHAGNPGTTRLVIISANGQVVKTIQWPDGNSNTTYINFETMRLPKGSYRLQVISGSSEVDAVLPFVIL